MYDMFPGWNLPWDIPWSLQNSWPCKIDVWNTKDDHFPTDLSHFLPNLKKCQIFRRSLEKISNKTPVQTSIARLFACAKPCAGRGVSAERRSLLIEYPWESKSTTFSRRAFTLCDSLFFEWFFLTYRDIFCLENPPTSKNNTNCFVVIHLEEPWVSFSESDV